MELLVQQQQINQHHPYFNEIRNLCHLSKNLYNATLYEIRQHYFKTKKHLSYKDVNTKFAHENQLNYRALPAKVSKMVQRKLDKNFKSFFSLCKMYQQRKIKDMPRIPKYLNKDGYFVVEYTKQALSFKRKGYIFLSKTNIFVKCDIPRDDIQCVRLVPRDGHFVIEICYKIVYPNLKNDNGRYASIDLGINNLMTVSSNVFDPFIISGKPIKSVNQFFNKTVAEYRSLLDKFQPKQYTSKRIWRLSRWRKNKIKDYFHKKTTWLVNQLVSNNVNILVVGYNKGWKQDINIGRVNNQKFVHIPFLLLVRILEYKCRLNWITLVLQEESYTSKSSFYNADDLPKLSKNKPLFSGYRKYRGLYKLTNDNKTFNCDLNGSCNILRKYLSDLRLDIYKTMTREYVLKSPYVIKK